MLLLRWGLVLISLMLGPDLRHGRVAHGSIMFRLTLDTMQTVQESTTGRGKPDVSSWFGYVWVAFPHAFVFGMVDCPVRDILGCSLNQECHTK